MAAPAAKAELNIQIPSQIASDPREWLVGPRVPQEESPMPMGTLQNQESVAQQAIITSPSRARSASLLPLR